MILVNGNKVDQSTFPVGEFICKLSTIGKPWENVNTIYFQYENNSELFLLALTLDALRRNSKLPVKLHMPYVPYARQDRVCNLGEPLSIKVLCDFINSLNFDSVTIHDPHSLVAPALLEKCHVEDLREEFRGFIHGSLDRDTSYYLISPDAGAHKKVDSIAEYLTTQYNQDYWPKFKGVIKSDKVRKLSDGSLSNFIVTHPAPSEEVNVLGDKPILIIVDDICDGGGTFLMLYKELRKLYPKVPIWLYTTFGFYTKGKKVLESKFEVVHSKFDWSK